MELVMLQAGGAGEGLERVGVGRRRRAWECRGHGMAGLERVVTHFVCVTNQCEYFFEEENVLQKR